MARLSKRHKEILAAFGRVGKIATTRDIASKLQLDVNGVSQSLNALSSKDGICYVECLGGKGGDCKWMLRQKP